MPRSPGDSSTTARTSGGRTPAADHPLRQRTTCQARYAIEFAARFAEAKYLDHMPLERQVRAMARNNLQVDSQTLWDQIEALARHLEPTYQALLAKVLEADTLYADETHWPLLGTAEGC